MPWPLLASSPFLLGVIVSLSRCLVVCIFLTNSHVHSHLNMVLYLNGTNSFSSSIIWVFFIIGSLQRWIINKCFPEGSTTSLRTSIWQWLPLFCPYFASYFCRQWSYHHLFLYSCECCSWLSLWLHLELLKPAWLDAAVRDIFPFQNHLK